MASEYRELSKGTAGAIYSPAGQRASGEVGQTLRNQNDAAAELPTLFNTLRTQYSMAVTLRERLRTIRSKFGVSSSAAERPEPGDVKGIPVGELASMSNEVLRECHNFIEDIDNFIGG